MENKLNKSSKALMTCDLINSIVSLFGDTFLVAYFLQISNENIAQVSIYYIIVYALLGLGNFLLGSIVKRNPKKRVSIYRFGIVVKSIFILLIILFKEKIKQYFLLVSIFYGIAEALYWAAHDNMNTEVVDNKNRKKFMTTKRMLGRGVSIIVPIILGTSIELTSFSNIAIYIFVLTLIQIIISSQIDINIFNIDGLKDKYSLKIFNKGLKKEQKENLNRIYKMSFLYGMMMDTIRTLVVIITIMTFKTSLNLGILTTLFSICSVISLYLYNKFYKRNHAKMLLTSCAILVLLGVVGLILNISKTTLILYNFTYSITIYVLEVMFKIKEDDAVSEQHIEKWLVEYHTFVEIFMDLGRITGFLLTLIISALNNISYFKLLLLLITISIPIYSTIMYKTEKTN